MSKHRRFLPSTGAAAVALGLTAAVLAAPAVARGDEPGPPRPAGVHHAPRPPVGYDVREPLFHPTGAWFAAQLVPSPELVVGRQKRIDAAGVADEGPRTAFGVRWQITPLLWSFGVHRLQSRWRTIVVDPIARQSGSLELSTTVEYIGGWVERLLFRPTLRLYLPLVDRGESLSVSFGTSAYRYDQVFRVAYEVGVYVLSGIVGLQLTVAPTHDPLASIATLRLRYF